MNKKKVPEIVFQGCKYFWIDNSWYDKTFIAVPKALAQKLTLNKPCVRIIKTPNDLTTKERQLRKRQIKKKAKTDQKNDIYDHAYRVPGDRYRK